MATVAASPIAASLTQPLDDIRNDDRAQIDGLSDLHLSVADLSWLTFIAHLRLASCHNPSDGRSSPKCTREALGFRRREESAPFLVIICYIFLDAVLIESQHHLFV
jgi:hypothetical protein